MQFSPGFSSYCLSCLVCCEREKKQKMKSLLFRNLFFTILQPGIVTVLIPYLILKCHGPINLPPLKRLTYPGIILYWAGLAILLTCIFSLALKGEGTLSPAAPTKKLVVSGVYSLSRNPMYIGITMMLAGEAIFFQSILLSVYALLCFAVFHIYIIKYEEIRLKKVFGDAYGRYCLQVKRWF